MRSYDFSPLYRSFVGFDRMANMIDAASAQAAKSNTTYPPYNVAVEYLHRGIAERGFERRFQLADHVRVSSAELTNGLLSIHLMREIPDALKPQKIAINAINAPLERKSDGKLIAAKSSKSKKAA